MNFRDPLGLEVYDGQAQARKHTRYLMRYGFLQYWFPHILESYFNYNTNPDLCFDLREKHIQDSYEIETECGKKKRIWKDRYIWEGQSYNPDYMGNISVGYSSMYAYGPVGWALISVGGEAAFSGTWEDAKASFSANWKGGKAALKDRMGEAALGGILRALIPWP